MPNTDSGNREPFKVDRQIGTIDTGYPRRAVVTIHAEFDHAGELHMTADAERPGARDIDQGGQMQDTLRELAMSTDPAAIRYAAGWDDVRLVRVLDLWDRWHLNHMNAACEHQRALGWPEMAAEPRTVYHWRLDPDVSKQVRAALKDAETALRRGETVSLPEDVAALARFEETTTSPEPTPPAPVYVAESETSYRHTSETKTRGWLRPSEHPDGLLTAPCPECGYRYGTEWRKEEIPTSALDLLRELLTPGGRA